MRHITQGPGWKIDSAGISGWHAGEKPDERATKAAAVRGYDMAGIKSRAVVTDDFYEFDRIYAMAEEHRRFLKNNAPPDATADVRLFLESVNDNADVPDPILRRRRRFENMMDLLEAGCKAIVAESDTGG